MKARDKVKTLVAIPGVIEKGVVGTVSGKDEIERGKTDKVLINLAGGGSLFFDEKDLEVVT